MKIYLAISIVAFTDSILAWYAILISQHVLSTLVLVIIIFLTSFTGVVYLDKFLRRDEKDDKK